MGYRKLMPVLVLLLLFIGCDNFYMICSLNPFYTNEKIVLEPLLEGAWTAKPTRVDKDSTSSNSVIWGIADTTSTWTIKRRIVKWVVKNKQGEDSTTLKPENYYIAKLSLNTDSVNYEFKVVLFRVKNHLYGDFVPSNKERLLKSKLAEHSFLEVHTLARISLANNQMQVSWLGSDCMKEMIEKKRVRVKYHYVQDANRLMLTAGSDDLTRMIERYADQQRFIDWDKQQAKLNFNRIK